MFLDERGNPVASRSLVGPLAAGVPGSVAGLALAQRKYGRLPLAEVIAPAIALARDGFDVSWSLADVAWQRTAPLFAQFPSSVRAFSARRTARRLKPASDCVQPDLATHARRLIAEQGPDAFYRGPIARSDRARDGAERRPDHHGDLAAYEPNERAPVTGTLPRLPTSSRCRPPSSGGVALVELLNILEGYPLADYGPNASRTMHLMIEAERRVYADRAEWLGDPEFFRVPRGRPHREAVRATTSARASIETRATPSTPIKRRPARATTSRPQTTHYSVVDADGNAVATTTTLNGGYGNGQVVTGAGFLLNNEMDDFSAKPGAPNMFGLLGGDANAIAPGKRMLSSMTPTIVVARRTHVAGGRQPWRRAHHHDGAAGAGERDRFRHERAGGRRCAAIPPPVVARQGDARAVGLPCRRDRRALEALGHTTHVDSDMGDVQAIVDRARNGPPAGASDPRDDGGAVGY